MAYNYDFQVCASMCHQMMWQLQTMQYMQQFNYQHQPYVSQQQQGLYQQPEYCAQQQPFNLGSSQRLGEGGHPLDQPLSLDVNIEYTLDKKKFIDLESKEPALIIDPSFWKQDWPAPTDSSCSPCSPGETSSSPCSSPYTPTVKSDVKRHDRQPCQYSSPVNIIDLLDPEADLLSSSEYQSSCEGFSFNFSQLDISTPSKLHGSSSDLQRGTDGRHVQTKKHLHHEYTTSTPDQGQNRTHACSSELDTPEFPTLSLSDLPEVFSPPALTDISLDLGLPGSNLESIPLEATCIDNIIPSITEVIRQLTYSPDSDQSSAFKTEENNTKCQTSLSESELQLLEDVARM